MINKPSICVLIISIIENISNVIPNPFDLLPAWRNQNGSGTVCSVWKSTYK
jgi:hypothetical protein